MKSKPMPRAVLRAQRTTLLAVGEGDSEEAFLKHLRSLYCADHAGVNVTVRNAHGKGPGNVVSTALGHLRNRAFDRALALLDTDLEWTKKDRDSARKANLHLIGSTPCLEGLLLKILQLPVPATSPLCKLAMNRALQADLTEISSYAQHFPKPLLQRARLQQAPELNDLLGLFDI